MSSLEEGKQNQVVSPAEVLGSSPESPPKQSFSNNPPAKSGFFMPGGALKDLDKDGDGFISRQEVEEFIGEHKIMNAERKLFKKAFIVLLITLMFFSAAIVLIVYGIILETKDTEMDGDVMVSKESGDAIQCASTDFVVVDGTLVPRDEADASRRLQMFNNFTLDDSTLSALGVRNIYKKRQLSSTMPDSYFQEMLWFDIQSTTGSFLWFRISSIARIPSVKAKCGTYLKLGTSSGTIILDENEIYYDDPMGSIFAASGLIAISQKDPPSRRKLSKIGHRDMRRLATDEFSIVGFFNSIEEKEWTCENIEKPQLPEFYSATYTVLYACDQEEGDETPDQCLVTIPENPEPIPGFGVVEVEGVQYAKHNSDVFVTSESSTFIDTFPHTPGMKMITQVFPDKTARFFQVTEDGRLAQCTTAENFKLEMKFPEDYIFYPLGEVNGNLNRYRLSYMGLTGTLEEQEQWIHIDYFEDATTKLPKSLITDGRIVQVDSMDINEESKPLPSYLSFTEEEFNTRLLATEVVNGDRYRRYVQNDLTLFDPDNITAASYRYQREWNAWDWNTTVYPPLHEPLAAVTYKTLEYYSVGHTTFTMDGGNKVYTGLDEFGNWVANIFNTSPKDPPPSNVTITSSNSTSRRLLKFQIDPTVPSITVPLKYIELTYAYFYQEDKHFFEVATVCDGVLCAKGSIDATIPTDAPLDYNVGGTVKVYLDYKAFYEELVKIRYDYYNGFSPVNYGLSRWYKAHVLDADVSKTFFGQLRGTLEVFFMQAKTRKFIYRYTNAGYVRMTAKAQYLEGVAGYGNWKTIKSWTFHYESWYDKVRD